MTFTRQVRMCMRCTPAKSYFIDRYARLVCLLFVLFSIDLTAQNQLPAEKEKAFLDELQGIFIAGRNVEYIASYNAFASYWHSVMLSPTDKERVITAYYSSKSKGARLVPHHLAFVRCMAFYADYVRGGEGNTQFIEVLYKTAQHHDINYWLHFLQTSQSIFRNRTLFSGPENTVKAVGGKPLFQYIEGDKEEKLTLINTGKIEELGKQDNISDLEKKEEDNWDGTDERKKKQANTEYNTLLVSGAAVKFLLCDLSISSLFDSAIYIRRTNGTYFFSTRLFAGNGGVFNWSDISRKRNSFSVELDVYSFNVSLPVIYAEKANLRGAKGIDGQISGVFEFKHKRRLQGKPPEFPRFISYKDNLEWKLTSRLSYKGGFSLLGEKIYSTNIDQSVASIVYSDGFRNYFTAHSRLFEMEDTLIRAAIASVVVFIGNDSISHPGVRMEFGFPSKKLRVNRDVTVFRYAPFIDTYHQLELSCDQIQYDTETGKIEFRILNAKKHIPMVINSYEYFDEKEFNRLQGIYDFNPLKVIAYYRKKNKSAGLYAADIATKNKIPYPKFKAALNYCMHMGFLTYHHTTDVIDLTHKGQHYLNAHNNKADYDQLFIPSLLSDTANATLSLTDKKLVVNGVELFYISDSLNVVAYPANRKLVIEKNRLIDFDGKLNAGIMTYNGTGFRFRYADFKIDMDKIETIKFRLARSADDLKKGKNKIIANELMYSSGTLFVNQPDNKSNRKKLLQYPRFNAISGACVYFDKKEVLNKAYDKSVYFKVPPFQVDSLNGSLNRKIGISGTFYSGGILPDFQDVLRIMPDNSLGFEHKIPESGYDLYKGKGKFYNKVTLSNKGLRGHGKMEYLAASFHSDNIVFYPDSLTGHTDEGTVKNIKMNETEYPDVSFGKVRVYWKTRSDTMIFKPDKDTFCLYNKTAFLKGVLKLSPGGVYGYGILKYRSTITYSGNMFFKSTELGARNARFTVSSPDTTKPYFTATDIRLQLYLTQKEAEITSEKSGEPCIEFPYNQFRTSINMARWYMDKHLLKMDSPDTLSVPNAWFSSTKHGNDSIYFYGRSGEYNMLKNRLEVRGVPFLKIADARILPDSQKVIVENAHINPMTNAEVWVDTLNGYHHLVKGTIEIDARNFYSGTAIYRYVNSINDTFLIQLNAFYFDDTKTGRKKTSRISVAEGNVSMQQLFFIAPRIQFRGKVTMRADKRYLIFKGHVKLDLKNQRMRTEWLPFESNGDSPDIVIDLIKSGKKREEVDNEGMHSTEEVVTGLHFDFNDHSLYSTFISHKNHQADDDLFRANGELIYSLADNYFSIGKKDRLENKILEGNIFRYNDSLSLLYCEGSFELLRDKNLDISAAGEATGSPDSTALMLNTLFMVKPKLPAKALIFMADLIQKIQETTSVTPVNLDKNKLISRIASIAGEKAARDLEISTDDNVPLFIVSNKFSKGIVFPDLHLKWSDKQKAWYSSGKIPLGNIDQIHFNSWIDGFMEIQKDQENGFVYTLYLEPARDTWFYFSYSQGRLQTAASDLEYNALVAAKSKPNTFDPSKYTFGVSEIDERYNFLQHFYKAYLGREFTE